MPRPFRALSLALCTRLARYPSPSAPSNNLVDYCESVIRPHSSHRPRKDDEDVRPRSGEKSKVEDSDAVVQRRRWIRGEGRGTARVSQDLSAILCPKSNAREFRVVG